LLNALDVLDRPRIAAAADQLDAPQRQQLLDGLRALLAGLPSLDP
jgi:hypothetical protein